MKNILSLTFFCLIAPVAFPAALPLANPGFEDGLKSWDSSEADKGMSAFTSEAARTGKLGLQVDDQNAASGSNLRSALLRAQPGASYQIDFWARVVDGEGVAVYLNFHDAQGKRVIDPDNKKDILRIIPSSTHDWQEFSLAATAPAGTVSVSVWIHSFNANRVKAHFDDFSLTSVTASAVLKHPSSSQSVSLAGGKSSGGRDVDQLIDYPKPSPEKTFGSLKVLQPDGSAYRTPVEDWVGARERIAASPAWAEWAEEQRKAADEWMVRHHDRPEWEAGWNHDFIDPKDSSFLVWTEDIPGEQIDHFMSRSGHRVEITPTLFRAWVGAFRKIHADKMSDVARVYRLTGDERYAEWVAGQLDFYAANYAGWGKGVGKRANSWLGFQSLDDAVIVSRLVEAARLIFDWAEPARRQVWRDQLFKPEAELLDKSYATIHNIALWQRATQAQVALLYGDEAMWTRVVDGEFGLRNQFRRGVTSDYFWYEQSMGYNDFIVMAMEPLLTFAGLVGQADRVRNDAAIVQNMMLAPLMIRFPDNTVPNPADSTVIPKAPSGWLTRTYRILPTTLGLAKVAGTYSWDTLIDPPEAVMADRNVLPEVASLNMESTRFGLLKKGPWQVFFHYGQVNKSHAQSEALNWSASYGDVVISRDPGTTGYGSQMTSDYYRRGLNHNVPLIDGEGQKPWHQGKLLRFDAEAGIMSAEQPVYHPKAGTAMPQIWKGSESQTVFRSEADVRRTLRIEGDALIDEASVKLTESGRIGLAQHFQGKVRLPVNFAEATDFTVGRPGPFKFWANVRSATFTDRAEFEVEFPGGLVLTVEFATPGEFIVYQGTSPDYPPASRTGFYLEKTGDAREAVFVTKIGPSKR